MLTMDSLQPPLPEPQFLKNFYETLTFSKKRRAGEKKVKNQFLLFYPFLLCQRGALLFQKISNSPS